MVLTPTQEMNIETYLQTMPKDIQGNISVCTEMWLRGETAHGYPHPAQVCANIQATNERQPFLSLQQSLNLQLLKRHLRQAV